MHTSAVMTASIILSVAFCAQRCVPPPVPPDTNVPVFDETLVAKATCPQATVDAWPRGSMHPFASSLVRIPVVVFRHGARKKEEEMFCFF